MRNLLENAQRYGVGTIEVALAIDPIGAAGTTATAHKLLLEVCDDGPGVPAVDAFA